MNLAENALKETKSVAESEILKRDTEIEKLSSYLLRSFGKLFLMPHKIISLRIPFRILPSMMLIMLQVAYLSSDTLKYFLTL